MSSRCLHCFGEVSNPRNTFCSSSCAATHNNTARIRIKKYKPCAHCGGQRNTGAKYCSSECQHAAQYAARAAKLKEGNLDVFTPFFLKKVILDSRGHRCESCNNETWMNNPIPLELEHIDGNHNNNAENNLLLLCPNCHALTPTYKGRNKGNGRSFRRERYANGKSY